MMFLIASIVTLITSAALAILGVDWLTIGHGLNPWLAFPLSAVFAVVSIVYMGIGVSSLRCEMKHQAFKRKQKRLGY